jgi:hypothetical protein
MAALEAQMANTSKLNDALLVALGFSAVLWLVIGVLIWAIVR